MRRVLILGGSHRDIPLIEAAKGFGWYVVTLGDRPYYIGHRYADRSYSIDFNDTQKVQEVIEKEHIDGLLPGCGEASYLQCVRLAHRLGLGHYDQIDVAELVHDKWAFKQFCLGCGVSTPKGLLYQEGVSLGDLSFPLLVKPTRLSGGRGVEVVSDERALHAAIARNRVWGEPLFLEEYIEGELIAYSIFLCDQKIVYGFVGRDESFVNPYLVTTAYAYAIPASVKKRLDSDIERLAEALHLVDGMFHLQILVKDGIPYIIDVTRRIAGDLYPYLIERSDHIDYSQAVVKAYLGIALDRDLRPQGSHDFVIRHCVMPDRNGIYRGLFIDPALRDAIVLRLDLMQEGALIEDFLHTQIAIVLIIPDRAHKKIVHEKIAKAMYHLIYPMIE